MKQARVLFDEFPSEAWSVRPEVARRMQPAHPEDSSYVRAARALAAHDFAVTPNTDRLLPDVLADADLLVIAHPSDPKWEFTTSGDTPRLSPTNSTRSRSSSAS
jgi:hypothetical protein